MRRFGLFVVLFAVVAVLAGALASLASAALPVNLPLGAERTWSGKNDEANPKLETSGTLGLGAVTCESAKATGTEEREKPLGLFHIEFIKCSSFQGTCTGLGDTTKPGVILSLGTWHLVFDNLTELSTATLFLPEAVHFECGTLLIEVLSGGSLVCLDLEPTVSKVTHLFHCAQKEGVANEKDWFDANGTLHTAQLLCSIDHETAKECAELALGEVTYGVTLVADI